MRGKRSPGFNIELGLAISELSLKPGQTRTQRELADFCGCGYQTIQHIERKALRKVRHRLRALLPELPRRYF